MKGEIFDGHYRVLTQRGNHVFLFFLMAKTKIVRRKGPWPNPPYIYATECNLKHNLLLIDLIVQKMSASLDSSRDLLDIPIFSIIF